MKKLIICLLIVTLVTILNTQNIEKNNNSNQQLYFKVEANELSNVGNQFEHTFQCPLYPIIPFRLYPGRTFTEQDIYWITQRKKLSQEELDVMAQIAKGAYPFQDQSPQTPTSLMKIIEKYGSNIKTAWVKGKVSGVQIYYSYLTEVTCERTEQTYKYKDITFYHENACGASFLEFGYLAYYEEEWYEIETLIDLGIIEEEKLSSMIDKIE